MSIGSMIYRSWQLGLIDGDERTILYRNMTRRGWRGVRREPFDSLDESPLERPRMLRRAVEAVVESGVWGREAFKSQLSLPASEIEQLLGLSKKLSQ